MSGSPSSISVNVLPDTNASTDSVNGSYTQASIVANLSTGQLKANEGPVTLSNGNPTVTLTSNIGGTITPGTQSAGEPFTISNGVVNVSSGASGGAVSADGNLIVVADTNSGDNPSIAVLLHQGTGVTAATFAGVYSVGEYGGTGITGTFGKAITLFAYGNGTYFVTVTKNASGTITTDMLSGTYTVAADGTLALTDTDGVVSTGAISADGNALVLGNVTSGGTPAIFVGVRQ